jgi:hypothetical protein
MIQRLCRAIEGTIFSVIAGDVEDSRLFFCMGRSSSTFCWAVLTNQRSRISQAASKNATLEEFIDIIIDSSMAPFHIYKKFISSYLHVY